MQIRYHFKDYKDEPTFFKDYAEEKLEKLGKMPFKLKKLDVVAYKEGTFQTIELVVQGFKVIRSQSTTLTMEDSLDRCIEKCLRQMNKIKLIHKKNPIREKRKKRRQANEIHAAMLEAESQKKAA